MTISLDTTAPSAARASGKQVMIVDDNRDAADSLQMLFEVYGYQAACAYDGRSALEAVRAATPGHRRHGPGHAPAWTATRRRARCAPCPAARRSC